MERLAALGQALNRSAALEAIRDVLHHQLYALAASDRAWVMVRNGRAWQMLAGSPRVPQRDIEAMCEQIAARQQMAPLRTGRHGALAIDGHLCFPMTGSGQVIAVLGVPADSAIPNSRRRRLAAAASLLGIALRNLELVHEMREHSVRDRLTGCATRVHGLDVIASELRRARRSQAPLSLVMFDLDYFARINERWGDQAGDAVLAAVGARLRALLRGSDLKCRYGGESFLVLLPDTPLDGAQRVADSLRRQIATVPVFWRGEAIRVTASFGVTTALPAETEADALVARADAALYRAKDHGRNCVRLSIEAAVA
jgi:diguanylate cyclase (GGDEF)-like protein